MIFYRTLLTGIAVSIEIMCISNCYRSKYVDFDQDVPGSWSGFTESVSSVKLNNAILENFEVVPFRSKR